MECHLMRQLNNEDEARSSLQAFDAYVLGGYLQDRIYAMPQHLASARQGIDVPIGIN